MRSTQKCQTELSQEAIHQSISLDIKPRPCPSYWPATQSTEWLQGHPITRQEDVEWLKAERGHLARIIQVSQMEANEMEQLGFIAGQWRGNIPMLRLFHYIIEDDIKPLFLCHNDACTRRELDQWNSSERPETVYKVIAKRWNDVDFNPTMLVIDCHDDFAAAIDVRFESVKNMTPANANNVEHCLTSLRTNLIRVIQNWE